MKAYRMFSLYTQRRERFPLSVFPVPKYLSSPIVGLDISDHAIRVVEMLPGSHGMRLGRQDRIDLPRGTIVDGDIQDEKTLVGMLAELRRKHRLGAVGVSMPTEHAYYFRLAVAGTGLSRKEVRGAIEFKLEESVPVSPQEAVFDYTFIEERSGRTDVSVTVMPHKIIDAYLSALFHAGLHSELFEVEPEALVRAVVPKGDKSTCMIIDLGEYKTILAIVSGGAVQFTAVIEVAGDVLTQALEKKLAISHEEAEKMKKDNGFQNTEENKKVFDILKAGVEELRDELLKHLEYWKSRANPDGSKNKPISRIYLCGGGANLKGLPVYLLSTLHSEVILADIWTNAFGIHEHIPNITFEESLSYATAVGLALAKI